MRCSLNVSLITYYILLSPYYSLTHNANDMRFALDELTAICDELRFYHWERPQDCIFLFPKCGVIQWAAAIAFALCQEIDGRDGFLLLKLPLICLIQV